MKWNTIKGIEAEGLSLKGIEIAVEFVDCSIKSLIFRDVEGKIIRIKEAGYGFAVCIPEPPKTETTYIVEGTIKNVRIREEYMREDLAESRLREIYSAFEIDKDSFEAKLSINTKEQVKECPDPTISDLVF